MHSQKSHAQSPLTSGGPARHLRIATWVCLLGTCIGPVASAATPTAKDVVLDNPSASAAQPVVRPVPRWSALATSLGDLGVSLLSETAQAGSNTVVSPLSVASALGLVQLGAKGPTALELGFVLDSGASKSRRLSADMPALLAALEPEKGAANSPLTMANRIWVDKRVTENASPAFVATAKQRWKADGVVVPFATPEPTRNTINQWVAAQTGQRIKEVLPPGSVSGNTRFVVTNAVHFKAPWAQPFDAKLTQHAAFKVEGAAPVQVPTMYDERKVGWLKLPSGETLLELPFEGRQYALLVLMPAAGTSLADAVRALQGADLTEPLGSLKPQNCQLRIPKFKLTTSMASLKTPLEGMGVRQPFTDGADFSGLVGNKSDVKLDDVFHAASFEIDEAGGEASAATAAVAVSKSFAALVPECAIDRPFVFALLHKPTSATLFVGQVANPAQQ